MEIHVNDAYRNVGYLVAEFLLLAALPLERVYLATDFSGSIA
jgi:hypothetical protein